MSERFFTALVVDAFLLFVVFESATGKWIRETYPTAGHIAVWLGILGCAVGAWAHLRRPDKGTQSDTLQLWALIALFVALFVVFSQESPKSTREIVLGFFLLFAIGKVVAHTPPR
jgi:hypothetical protein